MHFRVNIPTQQFHLLQKNLTMPTNWQQPIRRIIRLEQSFDHCRVVWAQTWFQEFLCYKTIWLDIFHSHQQHGKKCCQQSSSWNRSSGKNVLWDGAISASRDISSKYQSRLRMLVLLLSPICQRYSPISLAPECARLRSYLILSSLQNAFVPSKEQNETTEQLQEMMQGNTPVLILSQSDLVKPKYIYNVFSAAMV